MTYRIAPLPLAPFQPLFALDDIALHALGARRMIADTPNAAPCRVSLIDAAPGEALILAHHVHLDAPTSPYRGGGPIFVREAAIQASSVDGGIPDMLARRLLSVRLYDADAMMTAAEVVEGVDLDVFLRRAFKDSTVEQAQIHTARRGCYMARAVRL
jgi:hypothetical protein